METNKTPRALPCYAVLLIITLAAGLILGGTYLLTKDAISEREAREAEQTRSRVLSSATSFELIEQNKDGSPLNWLYAGKDAEGNTVGYVGLVTVNGYKAKIEVICGLDVNGKITGISVGGSKFAETVGLGAKAKDADFTDRFTGKSTPIVIIKTGDAPNENGVDALTSATITSRAVAEAVNRCGEYVSHTYLSTEETSQTKAGEQQ